MDDALTELAGQVDLAAGDIREALIGHHHRAALMAMARVYMQIAEQSPCCRELAAALVIEASARLISPFAGQPGAIH